VSITATTVLATPVVTSHASADAGAIVVQITLRIHEFVVREALRAPSTIHLRTHDVGMPREFGRHRFGDARSFAREATHNVRALRHRAVVRKRHAGVASQALDALRWRELRALAALPELDDQAWGGCGGWLGERLARQHCGNPDPRGANRKSCDVQDA
jgi:hypothetical protein